MPADNGRTRCFASFRSALKDLAEPFHVAEFIVRIADQVEDRLGFATHCINITQSVGGGYLPVDKGVIHNGWKRSRSSERWRSHR